MIPLNQQSGWIRRCHIILGVSAGVGLLLFYLAVYRPSTGRLSDIRREIASAELQISKNHDAARDLDNIKRDVQMLREQIARSRKLPPEQDLSGFLREITGLAQGASLEKFRCEPSDTRNLELCTEMPITLKFSGPFMEVSSFLRQAEEMPRMMRTRVLRLKSKDGKSGLVDAELQVSIFFGGDR
jgi:Tfp pilus assembly protein PilO